jgi:hypothetical protein
MDVEYKFHLNSFDKQKLNDILRRGPFFSDYDPDYRLYNFRLASNTDPVVMPNLVAAIEPDGLYVCDNGGSDLADRVINYLEAFLEGELGQLRIEEI